MHNKGFVIILTLVVTALCLYYLSFTYVSRTIQSEALSYAMDSSGTVDLMKKQTYIDSLWNKPVYHLFGAEYTYKEVKENELSLGLDLQGGMHVTLEVLPADIIRGLSINAQDSMLVASLWEADRGRQSNAEDYVNHFHQAMKKRGGDDFRLASFFVSAANRGRISISDADEVIIDFLREEIESGIDRIYTILKTRIDQFGTNQPNIQRLQDSKRIQIEIPGADNPKRVRKLLQRVAQLGFWEVVEYSDPQLSRFLSSVNTLLLREENKSRKDAQDLEMDTSVEEVKQEDSMLQDTTTNTLADQLAEGKKESVAIADQESSDNLTASSLFSLSSASVPFLYDVKDTAKINAIFDKSEVKTLFPRSMKYLWEVKPNPELTPGIDDLRLYFVNTGRQGKPLLTGEVIENARLDYDQFARPSVSMTMNVSGARTWAKITAKASSKSPPGRIAVVLDDYVYTAPTVEGEIPNGNSQITGSFDLEEAKDLANVLKAGSLPARIRIVEEAVIGPSMGKSAQNQGLLSVIFGLGMVALFMIFYYSKGGLVADLALLFNIFFILGILAQFNASLTLPGIAGIVLTMGMAVDANVLVFERIKEELKDGMILQEAVKQGYRRAFDTIFDSNVTTLLTAILLFVFGQGPLRGFAVVLIIGIATSFFSTIYISRVIVEWLIRKGERANLSFDSWVAKRVMKKVSFSFISYRRIAYVFSGTVILLGILVIIFKGLNLGVDFKGGRSYVVSFNHPVVATDMRSALSEVFENASKEVKNFGTSNTVKITTSYLIEDDSEEADNQVRKALIDGLENHTNEKFVEQDTQIREGYFSILSSSKVGPSIADDIKSSAYKAGFFSLIAIFLYIFIRFKKWQFSVGAVLATVHDALFVVATFAIAGVFGASFEVDQVFVAALLTVIGYSINDTVVIFDRMREYIGMGRSYDKFQIFNDAISNTLSRTIITSGTTLAVVGILFIFGGEVLHGFSFSLLIGVLVGTYSSIFVAAPVVYDMDKAKT